MKATQTGNELIIQETPGCLWFFGLFFALVGGVFVYGSLGGFSNWDKVPWWANALAFFMGAIGVAVGIWQIWLAPVTKIIINQTGKTVTVFKRGIFKNEREIYDFDQVKRFCTIEEKDSEGDPIWSFGMEFWSGKFISFSSLPSHSEKYKQDLVFQANQFCGKQLPAYQATTASEDESPREMS